VLRLVPALVGSFETLPDALEAAASQYGERDAFIDGDRRLTFAEWQRCADGLAQALLERGLQPGDRVAILLKSSIEYSMTYAAILRAGGIATGIALRLGPREFEAIVATAAPTIVVVDRTALPFPLPSFDDGVHIIEHTELPAMFTLPGLGADRPRRKADDAAVIVWTSGTTGVPKGAWFDHRNLEAAVRSAGVMSAPFDRRLVGTPFQHAGYMAKIWDQIAWGSAVIISPVPWTAESMLRNIVEQKITVAGGVPTQWAKLIALPGIEEVDFSHVRLGLVATAPASPELIERVSNVLGCPLIVRYAMTESPSITGTEPSDSADVLYRTVGRPQEGMEVDIVSVDTDSGVTTVVPLGEIGRVRIKGACVMRGYWGNDLLTDEVLDAEGRLTSSDLGCFDSDGNVRLVGRATDMYIRGGYNVYPLEVENVLVEHANVAAAAVIGVHAPVIGEIGVAFVVAPDVANPPTLSELRAWVSARLADYKAPDRVEYVDALPLTAMQKVDKAALRELVQQPQSLGDKQP
jgi:acyl-CoA synthetase (AMP-forming)/AMP-acid ligase II